MAKKKKPSRLAKALLETAEGMHKAGLLDRNAYAKITMRHLGEKGLPKVAAVTAEQIRSMRQRAKMSQAVFARHLNLTVGYVFATGTSAPSSRLARRWRCSTSSSARGSTRSL